MEFLLLEWLQVRKCAKAHLKKKLEVIQKNRKEPKVSIQLPIGETVYVSCYTV